MTFERIRRRIKFPEEIHTQQNSNNRPEENTQKGPGEFSRFINLHEGKSFMVCGCGVSLNDYDNFNNHITIGVNDAGTRIDCKYLVVVNEPDSFKWNRWNSVKSNNSDFTFTHLPNLPIDNPERRIVIKLGKYEGLNLSNYGYIDYTTNSPYMAIIIACQMGAKKIGLIGVDFTENHFFGETGRHQMMREIDRIKKQYSDLGRHLKENGIKIANLSSKSLIESWPKMTLQEFETI